ncbi:putative murein peptide carboxypeptidase [Planktothrix tepida]|uniref:Putative murein peptide carboxypeptidase n=1 Tax=Planktothrix tepida PCC 9214 TaxID=671072 RepID=A0A1J1LJC3_9CYAN|nr:LD-carboxypeptidase [Planktothrix tepida]CAD5951091.1 putative murein peptide carboxypeptidase [Planktothrix tepida]CUR32608.1 putative murein peptide carboxypeptidase [Planktothrix tepida PCC 9214]
MNRRDFLAGLTLTGIATQLPVLAQSASVSGLLKPSRLKPGDTVGLVTPASPILKEHLKWIQLQLGQQELTVKVAPHVLSEYGYLAGTDQQRAADINQMFADPTVKAIIATGGGWGSSRILSLLDYDLIRQHPKIFLGYSDITALLLGLYSQTGLVTFHGLLGTSLWTPYSVNWLEKLLFDAQNITFQNPANIRVETLYPGQAQGRLVGGNLSVLSTLVGSEYLPSWQGKILFVEDVGEDIYRIDRMLTHLKLAGILDQISGFIFSQCTSCTPGEGNEPSLTLWQVLTDLIQPLEIPAWYGSMMGHIRDQFTVPLGIEVEIDTKQGTIAMLENAVT